MKDVQKYCFALKGRDEIVKVMAEDIKNTGIKYVLSTTNNETVAEFPLGSVLGWWIDPLGKRPE